MKKILVFAALSIISIASFAQATEQKLSEKVKITFPGKPTAQPGENGATVYSYSKDSTEVYMAFSLDLGAMGLTADMITAGGDAIWEQMKGPMMQRLPGAVLTKDQVTTFKGKSAQYMEIDGTKADAPVLKGKRTFGYSFFVGAVLTNVTFYSSSPTVKYEDAKAFFDSVVITE